MLTPDQALAEVLGHIAPLADIEELPIAYAAGRVLAEAPASDVDIPPFRKSMMDGYAVRRADFEGAPRDDGGVWFPVAGESRAGAPFEGFVQAGQAIEIYTGAELPDELDAVVMVERATREGNRVCLRDDPRVDQHVQARAEILAAGAQPFEAGRRLSPVDLGVLAAIGAHPLRVRRQVKVAVLTTGDELVPPWEPLGPGQIREGNTLVLAARCLQLELEVVRVGIVPDDEEILYAEFERALGMADALITTGGVSMGRYDLVGKTFERLGVRPVLHKVAVKPGKPIWFGMQGNKPVLGLPGNPVSALLGLEIFVRPALAKLAGATGDELLAPRRRGVWRGKSTTAGDREDNLPCTLSQDAEGLTELHPLRYRGSADLVTVASAQAFAVLPAGTSAEPGQAIDYRPLG
jgi:molybdopterin molybdotransferase